MTTQVCENCGAFIGRDEAELHRQWHIEWSKKEFQRTRYKEDVTDR